MAVSVGAHCNALGFQSSKDVHPPFGGLQSKPGDLQSSNAFSGVAPSPKRVA
jgi:hypothetical protein